MKAIVRIATAMTMAMTLAMFTTTANAQDYKAKKQRDGKDKQEKFEQFQKQLEAEKIGFLTAQLELTGDDAQVFWPIYNDFCAKREAANKKQMKAFHDLADATRKGEGDPTALTQAFVNAQKDCAQINASIADVFKGVISDEKIAKLIIAEENFRREQFRKMSRQGEGHPGKGGPEFGGPKPGGPRGEMPQFNAPAGE